VSEAGLRVAYTITRDIWVRGDEFVFWEVAPNVNLEENPEKKTVVV